MAVRGEPAKITVVDEHRLIVMLAGTYIRAVLGDQTRIFEAICGKVVLESPSTRYFAAMRSTVEPPHVLLRAAVRH